MRKKPPIDDDFSYMSSFMAFNEVVSWLEDAKEAGLIRPPAKLIEQLKKYRQKCSEQVSKKPIGYGSG